MESFNPENHVELLKILDPRVNIGQNRCMCITVGGLSVTVLQITPSSNSTTLTYAVTSPSPQTILTRRAYISYQCQLTDNSANTGMGPYPTNPPCQCPFSDILEGPRPFSLTSASTNITFNLNGVNMSWQPDVLVNELMQYDCYADTTLECGCPSMLPRNLGLPFNYNSALGVPFNPPLPSNGTFGYANGSLYTEYYNEYARQWTTPDGVNGCKTNNIYNYNGGVIQATQNPQNNLVVSWSAVEPVIVPPFVHSNDSLVPGLIGVLKYFRRKAFKLSQNLRAGSRKLSGKASQLKKISLKVFTADEINKLARYVKTVNTESDREDRRCRKHIATDCAGANNKKLDRYFLLKPALARIGQLHPKKWVGLMYSRESLSLKKIEIGVKPNLEIFSH